MRNVQEANFSTKIPTSPSKNQKSSKPARNPLSEPLSEQKESIQKPISSKS